jgi:protoporphyrin/coproporphyrin ferrochelatase
VNYDALLFVSFGGPEGPDDVVPFMENVTRGRGIPRERLAEVGAHYQLFGGVSPINGQNRALIAALEARLAERGVSLPVYWGNRNWKPYVHEALEAMRDNGVSRALAFVTSAYSSASGCRQYREDIERAREGVPGAPEIDKIRVFYNHPGFVEPMIDNTVAAITALALRAEVSDLAFTAHSIPTSMAESSDYELQLRETCRLVVDGVAAATGVTFPWELVFQSRSTLTIPWLEPDINDHLASLHAQAATGVVMVPIGFISDHMEVVYDLDMQASRTADELGLPVERAATVGTDDRFVDMICELIDERTALLGGSAPLRRALGTRGPAHDVCPLDCCPLPTRPAARPPAGPSVGPFAGASARPSARPPAT